MPDSEMLLKHLKMKYRVVTNNINFGREIRPPLIIHVIHDIGINHYQAPIMIPLLSALIHSHMIQDT